MDRSSNNQELNYNIKPLEENVELNFYDFKFSNGFLGMIQKPKWQNKKQIHENSSKLKLQKSPGTEAQEGQIRVQFWLIHIVQGKLTQYCYTSIKNKFLKRPNSLAKKKKKDAIKKVKRKPHRMEENICKIFATDLCDIQNIFLKTLATQQ